MSYSAKIRMVQEDNLPAITYVIKDKNNPISGQDLDARDSDTWDVIDLTGYTAIVDVRIKGSVEVLETLPLAILDATSGIVLLDLTSSDFQKDALDYELETVVTSASNSQQTVYDMMLISVRARVKVTP